MTKKSKDIIIVFEVEDSPSNDPTEDLARILFAAWRRDHESKGRSEEEGENHGATSV